jgi:hypothetical protein
LFERLSLDGLPPVEKGLSTPEVDGLGRYVVQALVISFDVVVGDEVGDTGLEFARQVTVFQENLVFIERCQRSILPWVMG